jgi:diaminopimelate epimerase
MFTFFKYEGAGNDFILLDNRTGVFPTRERQPLIAAWCDRHFGIGADGLILLEETEEAADFGMRYFNADGRESTLCGNGGRCIVAFAKKLGIVDNRCVFSAADGLHEARINSSGWVELKMQDLSTIETAGADAYVLNTGSPHYIRFVDDLRQVDVEQLGRSIRNSDTYRAEGINVNFVQAEEDGLSVATYERGVEAETLACGTGVTAAVLAWAHKMQVSGTYSLPVQVKGGRLAVRFQADEGSFSGIWLCGPARLVFTGSI